MGGTVRQKAIVVAAALLFSVIVPRPAFALWGGGWLERLSGPGPFWGNVFDERFLCVALPGKAADADSVLRDNEWGRRLTRQIGSRTWISAAGCQFLNTDRNDPRLEVGVDFGFLSSSHNVLNYSNRPGLSEDDKKVGLRTFALTADVRVNRLVDVGASIGRASFRSPDADLFPGFSRLMVQPLRVTVRPLVFLSTSSRSEAFVLRFDATKFSEAFTDADFGAAPGTFNEPGEITWAWSFRVDPLALIWK
jgi:hypothetical protein